MLPAQTDSVAFDLQGHRGCRGLMPENTLPGFMKAVELGVTTLEMDVVISGDGMIVVSHEPWMSGDICTAPGGKLITKENERTFNLYKMTYAEIQGFDCGMKVNPKFPNQQKIQVVKPTLKMAVRMVRSFAEDNKYPQPRFNIEIKSDPKDYNVYQPEPAKFVEMVVTEIKRLGIEDITTIQSFDPAVLEELNKVAGHKYKISYLVESGKKLSKNLEKLTFKPDIYSPDFSLVTEAMVADCHKQGIKIIPWTINTKADMDRLKAWGIDGGITDFPDVVR
jgi:glycerophosphoryl diester phosphodiesterase